ncbi:MAG: PHP domain-containing protein [Desulfatiglandales bacterium]
MLEFKADLHIHTCLSPCGDLDMTPKKIIGKAKELGIGILAVTDHNSCGNVKVTQHLGEEAGLVVLPGIEITTREEVHLIAIFGEIGPLEELESFIYEGLDVPNRPEIFGYQVLVNEREEVEGFVEPLLIAASRLSLEEAVFWIKELGGLSIAAHIDKQSYSVFSQLGFIPPGLNFDAVEVWDGSGYSRLKKEFVDLSRFPVLTSSDAHFLHEIGRKSTLFYIQSGAFEEVAKALRSQEGRYIKGHCGI